MTYFEQFDFIYRDPGAKTLSFSVRSDRFPRFIDEDLLNELISVGKRENSIVRICLHPASESKLHTMLLYLPEGMGYGMHMHPYKSESYQIVAGTVKVTCRNTDIHNADTVLLSAVNPVMYMQDNKWHSLFAEGGDAVFTETRQGPFIKGQNDETVWMSDQSGRGSE